MKDVSYYQNVAFTQESPFVVISHTAASTSIVQSHWHQDLELNLLYEGCISFYIGGEKRDVSKGHIALINSEEIHSSVPVVDEKQSEITGMTLIIKKAFLNQMIPGYEQLYFRVNSEIDEQQIAAILRKIAQIGEEVKSSADHLRIASFVCEILSLLVETSEMKILYEKKGVGNLQSKAILSYIHDNYAEPLRENEVAKKFHFSKEYFCRLFKKYTGTTFSKYLQQCRMVHAAELLCDKTVSLQQVAQEVGFSSEQYFSNTFKKYYGQTPGQYRKQKRAASDLSW